ncbi:MAG: c-type cytochrome [Gammaproteobacteria bacterium]
MSSTTFHGGRGYRLLWGMAFVSLLAACNEQATSPGATLPEREAISRSYDFAQLQRGKQLFRQNCAVCHGAEAEGAANWQQRDADGKYPPPPLNGTAHAWHHSHAQLKDVIKKGTLRIGGNMPPWEDRLTEAEMDDIIYWFQAKWSDEIYAAWYRSHVAAKK